MTAAMFGRAFMSNFATSLSGPYGPTSIDHSRNGCYFKYSSVSHGSFISAINGSTSRGRSHSKTRRGR
jgi:hypothetical protein